ncbi:cobyrinate a,c-diamide synthase [Desulfospira joergensenii]|uniref:cobyrinate a,c-diamide synthase n=1 Tax=Desulfospira joergensenii TaxID=53329 RepID=UPI0003B3ED61|nr:cobyrinate a,c-diamide synthase [Desulfospira joergensenii]
MKGFVIAAAGSGSGKTTVTLALLAWLASKGIKVAPFKVGPDFIDPGHHTKIAGRDSVNLDSWMLTQEYNQTLFAKAARDADIAVVEGVMGLFDGYDGTSELGSTAQMAKILGLPVLLIVDVKGMARSAAAMVKGFETFDPDLDICGVIFSRTGSRVHYEYLKTAVEQHCKTPVLGCMPRKENIVMPERHLGLVTAQERGISQEVLSTLVSMVEENVEMNKLLDHLEPVSLEQDQRPDPGLHPPEKRPVIGVAKDKAFCFYYPDNLDRLREAGAEILEFSPLEQDRLPEGIDGIYFGGGYPEIFAENLSSKKDLMDEIRRASLAGMPIYGECGGFMFLSKEVSDGQKEYPMAGCFDFSIQMSKRLRSLGYREIVLKEDTLIGQKGDIIRGHEFHYSSLKEGENQAGPTGPVKNVYHVTSRAGREISLKGFQTGQTLGSYLHVHFGSNPSCARSFVRACSVFKENRQPFVRDR